MAERTQKTPLREQLAKTYNFPWGLLSPSECVSVERATIGPTSVTKPFKRAINRALRRDNSEGYKSPWLIVSEERAKELVGIIRSPFPWSMVTPEERTEIERYLRGIAMATSGGVIADPWEFISGERRNELRERVGGIMRATSGNPDPALFLR